MKTIRFRWLAAIFQTLLLVPLSGCSGLFLYPSTTRFSDPSQFGFTFEETLLDDGRGPRLIVWNVTPSGEYRGTILFVHGNAENVSTHMRSALWLAGFGYRVILFDYRGYGGSQGTSSLAGVHDDTQRLFDYVRALEPDQQKRFLFGQSLGATVALFTAHKNENIAAFSAIIADSPFASYREIAREKLASFWLSYLFQYPLGFLVTDQFSPIAHMQEVTQPILYLHGELDQTVPAHHSADLCAANKDLCTRWTAPTAGHTEMLSSMSIRDRVVQWIKAADKKIFSIPHA